MRIFLYIGLIFLIATPTVSAQSQFFETLYDVPLMNDMKEVPEMALSFDKPNGRIAEAGAVTKQDSEATISNFYKTSLFQMGWKFREQKKGKKDPVYDFIRDGEKLSIFIEKSGSTTLVRFLLQPYEG